MTQQMHEQYLRIYNTLCTLEVSGEHNIITLATCLQALKELENEFIIDSMQQVGEE